MGAQLGRGCACLGVPADRGRLGAKPIHAAGHDQDRPVCVTLRTWFYAAVGSVWARSVHAVMLIYLSEVCIGRL